jgi:hypothetical protein
MLIKNFYGIAMLGFIFQLIKKIIFYFFKFISNIIC